MVKALKRAACAALARLCALALISCGQEENTEYSFPPLKTKEPLINLLPTPAGEAPADDAAWPPARLYAGAWACKLEYDETDDEALPVNGYLFFDESGSVRYEIGLFEEGEAQSAASGHFVHVYVDRATRRPTELPEAFVQALKALQVPAAA